MEWLSQNWIWLAAAALIIFMMRRGGAGGCCGSMHSGHDKETKADGAKPGSAGGASCCGGGNVADDKRPETDAAQGKPAPASPAHHH